MRRLMMAVVAALVLSVTMAACTSMSDQGMSDKSKAHKSTDNGGSHY
jgi:hypothetical protein